MKAAIPSAIAISLMVASRRCIRPVRRTPIARCRRSETSVRHRHAIILKAHRDAVAVERPEVLDQAVSCSFAHLRVRNATIAARPLKNFGAVAPAAVLGIGERHALGIARIPGVFGHARLLRGGLSGEWR